MKLQLVPAQRGLQWVRQGFGLFFRQPLPFAGLFATFLFALFALSMLPGIGAILVLTALPLASLGFMIGSQRALHGEFPLPRVFVEPLRQGRTRQFAIAKLGLIYAAATAAILWLSDTVDGGALDTLMRTMGSRDSTPAEIQQQLLNPNLHLGLMMRFGLTSLLAVPFWHAPALVHWGGQGAAKSMFFSLMAVWRNRGAFVLYALGWVGVIVLFALLANLVFGLLGQVQLVALAAMPASLIFSTVFYVSLYFTFADCFDVDESAGGAVSAPATHPHDSNQGDTS